MSILSLPKSQPQSLSFRQLEKLQVNNLELLKCKITQNLRILETRVLKSHFLKQPLDVVLDPWTLPAPAAKVCKIMKRAEALPAGDTAVPSMVGTGQRVTLRSEHTRTLS